MVLEDARYHCTPTPGRPSSTPQDCTSDIRPTWETDEGCLKLVAPGCKSRTLPAVYEWAVLSNAASGLLQTLHVLLREVCMHERTLSGATQPRTLQLIKGSPKLVGCSGDLVSRLTMGCDAMGLRIVTIWKNYVDLLRQLIMCSWHPKLFPWGSCCFPGTCGFPQHARRIFR